MYISLANLRVWLRQGLQPDVCPKRDREAMESRMAACGEYLESLILALAGLCLCVCVSRLNCNQRSHPQATTLVAELILPPSTFSTRTYAPPNAQTQTDRQPLLRRGFTGQFPYAPVVPPPHSTSPTVPKTRTDAAAGEGAEDATQST